MNYQEERNHDELRARFTKWMEITLYRARYDYLRKHKRLKNIALFPEITESMIIAGHIDNCEDVIDKAIYNETIFFYNESLEQAFNNLSKLQQDILVCIFVFEMTNKETARYLGCSVRQVYKQKERAFGILRKSMEGEGNA